MWRLILLCGIVSLPGSERSQGTRVSPTKPRVTLLVPAYFYPSGPGLKEWDRLIADAGRVPVIAIANVNTGPGAKVDPSYAAVLPRARAAGITLVGYVSTSYARRPLAEVKADIDTWVSFYPSLQGVFLDQQASDAKSVEYYLAAAEHARRHIVKALVVSNPGTICAEDYLRRSSADIICVFENHQGFDQFALPDWAARYSASRFAVLPYHVRQAELMRSYIHKSVTSGVGRLYVTDATGANPWDRLPRYWAEEVATAQALNRD